MSVLKIHGVSQINEDEDGEIFLECLVEVRGCVFETDVFVEDLNEAYKIKRWCDTHIEPYEISGEVDDRT